jgi:hypothetical protein
MWSRWGSRSRVPDQLSGHELHDQKSRANRIKAQEKTNRAGYLIFVLTISKLLGIDPSQKSKHFSARHSWIDSPTLNHYLVIIPFLRFAPLPCVSSQRVSRSPIGQMASSSRALSKLAVPSSGAASLKLSAAGPRLLLQSPRRTIGARPAFGSIQGPVTQQFRRGFADGDARVPPPPPKKPRFRKLRWAWRLGYISAIAGVAYLGYGVYLDRHPEPQVEPDPSKKTLVILGKLRKPLHPRAFLALYVVSSF